MPAFSVGHFVSVKLYCGILNQESTLVICSNRCYFTSNRLVSCLKVLGVKGPALSLGGQGSLAYLIRFTQRLDSDTQLVFAIKLQ